MKLKVFLFIFAIAISNLYAAPVVFQNATDRKIVCVPNPSMHFMQDLSYEVTVLAPGQTKTADWSPGNWQIDCMDQQHRIGSFNGTINIQDELIISPSSDDTRLDIEHQGGFSNE